MPGNTAVPSRARGDRRRADRGPVHELDRDRPEGVARSDHDHAGGDGQRWARSLPSCDRRTPCCHAAVPYSVSPPRGAGNASGPGGTTELRLGRSPEAIWADLVAEGVSGRLCVETIYAAVFAGVLDVKATECLRTRRPRRRRRQPRCENKRPGLPNISARPAAVADRDEPGQREGDQVIGADNRSSMLWLTERVTRYSIGVTVPVATEETSCSAGSPVASARSPRTCSGRSPSTRDPSGPAGRTY